VHHFDGGGPVGKDFLGFRRDIGKAKGPYPAGRALQRVGELVPGLPARAVILGEFLELRQRGGALILEQLEDLRVQTAIATGVAIEVIEIDRAFRGAHGLMMRPGG